MDFLQLSQFYYYGVWISVWSSIFIYALSIISTTGIIFLFINENRKRQGFYMIFFTLLPLLILFAVTIV